VHGQTDASWLDIFLNHDTQALVPLIARRFSNPGDVTAAQAMVDVSSGIQRTREMAAEHAAAAVAAVSWIDVPCLNLANLAAHAMSASKGSA
jgi:geranylgeranyl pyrophosphate synthase